MRLRDLFDEKSDLQEAPDDGPVAARSGLGDVAVATPQRRLDDGVSIFTAELFSADRYLVARLTSAEQRLSDHLNSSVPTVELRPVSASEWRGGQLEVGHDRVAQFGKSRLLFVVPLAEPPRANGTSNDLWKPLVARRCMAGLGPYNVEGTIHTEANRDAITALRLLDKKFQPWTDVDVTFPDGSARHFDAIIVNRSQLDLFVVMEDE